MVVVTGESHYLALRALELLDAGAMEELRTLLEDAAGIEGDEMDRAGSQLTFAAAACTLGLSVARRTDYWNSVLSPEALQVPLANRKLLSGAGITFDHELSGEPLSEVRAWLVENVQSLRLAQRCMSYTSPYAGLSSPFDLKPVLFSLTDVEDVGYTERPRLPNKVVIADLLSTFSAARGTSERAILRVIYWAREAGLTQRQVAESLRRPQTYVFRQLQQIDADPRAIAMTPREIYDHYLAGHVDRAQLLGLLAAYRYEAGSFPDDAPDWGYVPGSYDQLIQLAAEGSITAEELDAVLAGIDALAAQNG